MTGPRGYDVIALSAEFDIDRHRSCRADSIEIAPRGIDSFGRDLNRSSFEKVLGFLIVDEGNHQSSTGMAETLMGPEDLAGGSCRRGNAFVALDRLQPIQSSRLWLVVGEGLSVM